MAEYEFDFINQLAFDCNGVLFRPSPIEYLEQVQRDEQSRADGALLGDLASAEDYDAENAIKEKYRRMIGSPGTNAAQSVRETPGPAGAGNRRMPIRKFQFRSKK